MAVLSFLRLSRSDFDYVRDLVQRRSAIVIDADKQYLVESRLCTLARREGFSSPTAMLTQLRLQPGDLDKKVVEAMTTNETMFFRDMGPFEALRKTVLPELIQRRGAEQRLSLWCAACSSGQEPYSVAILLREHFPQIVSNWALNFIASDLSTEMLARARAGRYSQIEVNRGLPAPILAKYFRKEGATWQIAPEVQRMVEFREINLCKGWPAFPEMDIIFMRNVLIYFDVEAKRAILARARRALRPDGYLFVGGAETTLNLDDAFKPVLFEKTVFYRLQPALSRTYEG